MVLIIFLSTRCVTFSILPLGPFKCRRTFFQHGRWYYIQFWFSRITYQRFPLWICLYSNWNSFLKLVFLAFLYWNITILVALRTLTLLRESYLLLSHSISCVKNPKCTTFLGNNVIFLLLFYYAHSIRKDFFHTFYTV